VLARLVPARLARILLVIALLAGWQAALQHPIEHVDEAGSFVHLHDGHSDDSERAASCDLLAALTACATGGPVVFASFDSEFHPPSFPQSAARLAEAPPFRSHAPPVS
jgi:hypothetical protein